MSENILEMQNVTTCVNEGTSEEKEILQNISLNVKKGDFITLLGTNGAGKSTLLNVINGSLSPRSGSLKIAGNDVTKLSVGKRARFISQVFQDPKAGTAPRMTVAENLLLSKRRGQKRRLKLRFKTSLARGQAGVAPAGAGWGVSCPGTSNFLLLSKESYQRKPLKPTV